MGHGSTNSTNKIGNIFFVFYVFYFYLVLCFGTFYLQWYKYKQLYSNCISI